MFFFFRKPTVTIDALVPERYAFAAEYAPIQKASKFIPEWFYSLPSFSQKTFLSQDIDNREKNVKGCPGVLNSLNEGFVIPFWCDVRVDWDDQKSMYRFSDNFSILTYHHPDQAKGFSDNYWITKIESPWLLRFSRPMKIIHFPLTYFFGIDYPVKTLHSIQETRSKFNAAFTNNFFLFKKSKEPNKIIMNLNKPFNHFLLPSEFSYKINFHIDDPQYNVIHNTVNNPISFVRKALKQMLLDKKNREK